MLYDSTTIFMIRVSKDAKYHSVDFFLCQQWQEIKQVNTIDFPSCINFDVQGIQKHIQVSHNCC